MIQPTIFYWNLIVVDALDKFFLERQLLIAMTIKILRKSQITDQIETIIYDVFISTFLHLVLTWFRFICRQVSKKID